VSALQPLLDRDRYSDEEWKLAVSGRCGATVEYGNGRGVILCGEPSDPVSFYRWCTGHDTDAREQDPGKYGR
jgi:hypothetical protein